MSIPLSKLIKINDLIEKLYYRRPIDKETYDTIEEFGDSVERDVSAQAIQNLREYCWMLITYVLYGAEVVAIHDFSKQGHSDVKDMKDAVAMALTLMVRHTLQQLGVEPTRENFTETMFEYAKRHDDFQARLKTDTDLREQLKKDLGPEFGIYLEGLLRK